MSRRRIFGSWGIEHIVLKGNNDITIFNNDDDCLHFLNLLYDKLESSTSIISYVLMKNHVHLILKDETPGKISKLIMIVASRYANWYNAKYNHQNALFRPKFYNESVEEEQNFLNVLHYIHNNPVKAGIVSHPKDYKWSSYNEYIGNEKYIDKSIFQKYFNEEDCIFSLNQVQDTNNPELMYTKSYEYAKKCVEKYLSKKELLVISQLTLDERNELIKYLFYSEKIDTLRIAKVMNLSLNYTRKIIRSEC